MHKFQVLLGLLFSCLYALDPLIGAPLRTLEQNPCFRARKLFSEVAARRKLFPSVDLQCAVLSREQFLAHANALSAASNAVSNLDTEAQVYKLLGIIPEDYAYRDCVLQESGASSSALYDHTKKIIFLRADEHIPDSLLAHEIVHALQDQSYNLGRLYSLATTTDSDLAISALIEGDAMDMEARFTPTASDSPPEEKTNDYAAGCEPQEPLKSIYFFPYEWGPLLFQRLTTEEREHFFIRPLLTSLSIMKRKRSTETDAGTSPASYEGGEDWRDSLGAYVLLTLLKAYTNPRDAASVARNWKKDEIRLQDAGSTLTLTWQIEFSGVPEAGKALEVFQKYLEGRFGKVLPAGSGEFEAIRDGVPLRIQLSSKGAALTLNFSGKHHRRE